MLEAIVEAFIKKNIDELRTTLLGLSGGPDSLALFHLLRTRLKHLHVVHVNHGWRQESDSEAEQLAILCGEHGVPFSTTRLDLELKGNLEDRSRKARFEYFSAVAQREEAQGIFLAHHADDQAETVFKRVIEGAGIAHLRGMKEISNVQKLTIFRPLLTVSKQQLIDWADAHGYRYFIDPTNTDRRFLRGAFREAVFPFLHKQLGKNCIAPLCRLGVRSQELSDFLDERVEELLAQGEKSDLGIFFDFQKKMPHSVEIEALLKNLCSLYTFALSYWQMIQITALLKNGAANKRIAQIVIDRRCLFVVKNTDQQVLPKKLSIGSHRWGNWEVVVKAQSTEQRACRNHWKDLWRGLVETVIPADQESMLVFDSFTGFRRIDTGRVLLKKWLNTHKVPAFLRHYYPKIIVDEMVYEDFLTGYMIFNGRPCWHVTLKRISTC